MIGHRGEHRTRLVKKVNILVICVQRVSISKCYLFTMSRKVTPYNHHVGCRQHLSEIDFR